MRLFSHWQTELSHTQPADDNEYTHTPETNTLHNSSQECLKTTLENGAYLSRRVDGVGRKSAAGKVLPKEQRLLRLLPGQAVTVILELTLPPEITHTFKNQKCRAERRRASTRALTGESAFAASPR